MKIEQFEDTFKIDEQDYEKLIKRGLVVVNEGGVTFGLDMENCPRVVYKSKEQRKMEKEEELQRLQKEIDELNKGS